MNYRIKINILKCSDFELCGIKTTEKYSFKSLGINSIGDYEFPASSESEDFAVSAYKKDGVTLTVDKLSMEAVEGLV